MRDQHHKGREEAETAEEQKTSEDVSALCTWANVDGAAYRDFSSEQHQLWTESRSSVTARDMQLPRSELDAHAAAEQDVQPTGSEADVSAVASPQEQEPETDQQAAEHSNEKPARVLSEDTEANGLHREQPVREAPIPDEGSGRSALQRLFQVPRKASAGENQAESRAENGLLNRYSPLILASMSGGTGKTMLAANLGCALASEGESSLLVEASPVGHLSYYFGGSESRAGVVRTFESDSDHAPVQVLTLSLDEHDGREKLGPRLYEVMARFGSISQRVILNVSCAPFGTLRQIFPLNPVIVVPVVPNMRSLLEVQSMEKLLDDKSSRVSSKSVRVYYLLNRFDPSISLHRQMRETMIARYGDKVLPFEIRESQLVDEALAHGASVIDYSPESGITQDIRRMAEWTRKTVTVRGSVAGLPRWSER